MTPEQIELARHSLGLSAHQTTSYRNSFVTGHGAKDHLYWLAMVDAGDAIKRDGAKLPFGGDDLFHLTFTGASKALRLGESLSLEDFPEFAVAKSEPSQ